MKELRLHNYNNFIAFAASYCPNKQCDLDTDEHYSSLILFSYPNTKDENLYLDKYLFDHNNININNAEIDLKEQFNIDNNIFGYILSSISIKEINDCGDYKLYSSKYETKEIIGNSVLENDENIILKYTRTSNIYPTLNCKIQYSFIVTEPEFDIYDSYPEYKQEQSDEGSFEFGEYIGKLAYYNIILDQQLTSTCENNCDLCLQQRNNYCITCKYTF